MALTTCQRIKRIKKDASSKRHPFSENMLGPAKRYQTYQTSSDVSSPKSIRRYIPRPTPSFYGSETLTNFISGPFPSAANLFSRINGLFHRLSLSPNHNTLPPEPSRRCGRSHYRRVHSGDTKPGYPSQGFPVNKTVRRKLQMFQSSYKLSDQPKQSQAKGLGQVAILYATLYEVESSGGFPAP